MANTYAVKVPSLGKPVMVIGLDLAKTVAEYLSLWDHGNNPPSRWRCERRKIEGYAGEWPIAGRYVLEVGYKSTAGRGRGWVPVARLAKVKATPT